MQAAYLAMDVIVFAVIVPFAVTTVLVGIVNAVGTPWGLLRHYWVLIKLLLTLFATTVLLVETTTVGSLADAATRAADPRALPGTLVHSVGGLVVLLSAVVLSIYKPRGMTRYGWRRQRSVSTRTPVRPG